ncbi:MAG: hypothetical protein ACOCZV_01300 [Nanoarchaeota archaeon]
MMNPIDLYFTSGQHLDDMIQLDTVTATDLEKGDPERIANLLSSYKEVRNRISKLERQGSVDANSRSKLYQVKKDLHEADSTLTAKIETMLSNLRTELDDKRRLKRRDFERYANDIVTLQKYAGYVDSLEKSPSFNRMVSEAYRDLEQHVSDYKGNRLFREDLISFQECVKSPFSKKSLQLKGIQDHIREWYGRTSQGLKTGGLAIALIGGVLLASTVSNGTAYEPKRVEREPLKAIHPYTPASDETKSRVAHSQDRGDRMNAAYRSRTAQDKRSEKKSEDEREKREKPEYLTRATEHQNTYYPDSESLESAIASKQARR